MINSMTMELIQKLERRIEQVEESCKCLEKDSHPPIGLCEFDGFKELVKRIEELENAIQSEGTR
tara:strand:+ start:950 stop:1141 length:192 start_codon:yes stop_codon:yes gene_type:complete